MSDRRRFFLATLLALGLTAAPAFARPTQASALAGTWDGTYEPPGTVGGDPLSLLVSTVDGERVRGTLVLPAEALPFEGELAGGKLRVEVPMDGATVTLELTLADGTLAGQGRSGVFEWGFALRHVDDAVLTRTPPQQPIALAGRERPASYSLEGLPVETSLAVDELIGGLAEKNGVIGLSVACVVGGALVDVRSLGWEDLLGEVPATGDTRYRWASVSKPLAAVTALRLARGGAFDLDADVRTFVPEFPEKLVDGQKAKVTPRLILCHQSGITHYEGARRTWRSYDAPHPFDRLVNGLDLFATSPLRFAPGTKSEYSTHAWTLLGVAMERAAKKPFAELVRESVLVPLGMTTTEPDRVASSIPHRTHGYERGSDGTLYETLDDDVAWKLPGGGWTSTVADLARFGAGLCGAKMLSDDEKRMAWTEQVLPDGKGTGSGLGFFLGTLEGHRAVVHSGGQRKTSTFLAVLPERGLAVAAMCNTQGAPMEDVAFGTLRILLKMPPR